MRPTQDKISREYRNPAFTHRARSAWMLFAGIVIFLWANTGNAAQELANQAAISATGPNLPSKKFDYETIALPDHFVRNDLPRRMRFQNAVADDDNMPADNPVTNAGATLGRVLFYDKNLSANATVACASCHIQKHAFSDPKQFSIGLHGEKTGRHSMGLSNARYFKPGRFFLAWAGGIAGATGPDAHPR